MDKYYDNIKEYLIDNEVYSKVKDNKYVIEHCSDKRIISREYKLL